jgi:hypothetical protein
MSQFEFIDCINTKTVPKSNFGTTQPCQAHIVTDMVRAHSNSNNKCHSGGGAIQYHTLLI